MLFFLFDTIIKNFKEAVERDSQKLVLLVNTKKNTKVFFSFLTFCVLRNTYSVTYFPYFLC